jgi:hypothetical protein
LDITKHLGQIAQMSGHGTGLVWGMGQGCRHVQAFLVKIAGKSASSDCSEEDE